LAIILYRLQIKLDGIDDCWIERKLKKPISSIEQGPRLDHWFDLYLSYVKTIVVD
jgi:hypothetical protein